MSAPATGYLLIADITGYTAYLSESELEHAQGTLTALLEVLLDHTKPPLVLSRLAGDAVISYALGDAFASGQTFVDLIENTYVAFRRTIDQMVMNNTCTCTACANVGSLDLKFFVHHGTFARQKLSAHEELLGNDVNLLHRLLKNSVVEATGLRAYALYTQAAIDKLGLEGFTDTMRSHRETYDHLGDVDVWVADMARVWSHERKVPLPPLRTVYVACSVELAMEPAAAWDYVTTPEYMRTLLAAHQVGVSARTEGRVAPGTVYHCHHGANTTQPLTVLEWTPFERILLDGELPLPVSRASMLVEYVFEPTAAGCRLTQRIARPTGPALGRWIAGVALRSMRKSAQVDLDAFKVHIEADHAGRGAIPPRALPSAEDVRAAARSCLVLANPPA